MERRPFVLAYRLLLTVAAADGGKKKGRAVAAAAAAAALCRRESPAPRRTTRPRAAPRPSLSFCCRLSSRAPRCACLPRMCAHTSLLCCDAPDLTKKLNTLHTSPNGAAHRAAIGSSEGRTLKLSQLNRRIRVEAYDGPKLAVRCRGGIPPRAAAVSRAAPPDHVCCLTCPSCHDWPLRIKPPTRWWRSTERPRPAASGRRTRRIAQRRSRCVATAQAGSCLAAQPLWRTALSLLCSRLTALAGFHQVLDPRTRMMLFKLLNRGVFDRCGCREGASLSLPSRALRA